MEYFNEVLEETRERMQTQGLFKKEEYFELVEEVVEEKRDEGEIPNGFDFEALKAVLQDKWKDIKEDFSKNNNL